MLITFIADGYVMRFQPVALIKREHKVYSIYYEASFPDNIYAIASSLVFGDDFIHSYNLEFPYDNLGLLIVRTYSRHNSTCCVVMRITRSVM
jgi:hypothetical protein